MITFDTEKKVPHIVLADDDADECMIFMHALENLSIQYIFSLAENGAMLLNMLDEHDISPDVIFINLNMKGISGKDCLLAIRTSKKLDTVPIVVYSKSVDYLDIDYCYNATANLYVVNNSFVSILGDLLEKALLRPLTELLSVDEDDSLDDMVF